MLLALLDMPATSVPCTALPHCDTTLFPACGLQGVEGFQYTYYEDLTPADMVSILDTLKKGGKPKVRCDVPTEDNTRPRTWRQGETAPRRHSLCRTLRTQAPLALQPLPHPAATHYSAFKALTSTPVVPLVPCLSLIPSPSLAPNTATRPSPLAPWWATSGCPRRAP